MPRDDAARLGALYDAHATPVWRYVVHLTGDRAAADDVVQETLLRAWRTPGILAEDPSATRSWMYTVARHLVVDEARSARRRREIPVAETPDAVVRDATDAVFDSILDRARRDRQIPVALRPARSAPDPAGEGSDAMTAEHDRFADWDAAYILGRLGTVDRENYEAHLADCAVCLAAVAELAPLPGLLSRVPRERALSLLESSGVAGGIDPDEAPDGPDPACRVAIIGLGEARSRRTRRVRWAAAGIAAAALAGGILLAPTWLTPDAPAIALEPLGDLPLSASVRLDDVAWGTRLTMTCSYEASADAPAGGWEYELFVIAEDGAESQLSTWRALPERTAEIVAGTALRSADIAAVEVRSAKTGAVLMSTAPDEP